MTLRGPIDAAHCVRPPHYDRFFPRDPPAGADGRRVYATELLGKFATRAFRRRVEQADAERLAALAESVYTQSGQTFEAGVAQAMAAVLASPRFLFREEVLEADPSHPYPLVDEYSLASRLSYFLWSSMPDDELIRLAREHKLRENLPAQVERMLGDRKSDRVHHAVRRAVAAGSRHRDVADRRPGGAGPREPRPRSRPAADRFRELLRKDPETLTEAEKKEFRGVRDEFFRRFDQFRKPSSAASSAARCAARPRCCSSASCARTAACWS